MHRLAFIAGLSLICMNGAHAEAIDDTVPAVAAPQALEQVLYKGIGGNLLDAVPLEPEARVSLQRANAVISNSLSARSLAIALGIANPVFLVAGVAWGIWAAINIRDPEPDTTWLAPPQRPALGFCSRPNDASCQLHISYGEATDPVVEAVAGATLLTRN